MKSTMTVHISYNNEKTGIPSFSLLAGDMHKTYAGYTPKSRAEQIAKSGVCGTCAGTCPGCYALKMTRYTGVIDNYIDNTLFSRADPVAAVAAVEREIFKNPLTAPRAFRIHDSGDFFGAEYFAAWVDMIRRHPETQFGCYTKARNIVLAYGIENLPANFSLQCSPWPGVCDPIADLPQFIYDDGTVAEYANLPHCPAVDKNGNRTGVTCAQCGHCYQAKRGQRWAVYAH